MYFVLFVAPKCTCRRSKDGSILARSEWLIMKKSDTFQAWIFIDDFVSTQLRHAKYVAWRRLRMWISSMKGNSSGSWAPCVTMSLRTSGRHRLFKCTNIWEYKTVNKKYDNYKRTQFSIKHQVTHRPWMKKLKCKLGLCLPKY